jgi:pyruvate/2-oxoacid:ferredoxin oxidoreductase alpha subunit
MANKSMLKGESKVLTGNQAAAYGVLLCRPDVICAYPITPQSEVVTTLSQFSADGLLDAEMVEVEGELSALSVLLGASAAGARCILCMRRMMRRLHRGFP